MAMEIAKAFVTIGANTKGMREGIRQSEERMRRFGSVANRIIESTKTAREKMQEKVAAVGAVEQQGGFGTDPGEINERRGRALKAIRKEFEQATGATRRHKKAVAEAGRVYSQTRTPIEQYKTRLQQLNRMRNQGRITEDTHKRAVQQARSAVQSAIGVTAQRNQLQRRANQIIRQTMPPQEAYNRELAELNVLLRRGMINQQQFNQAQMMAQERMKFAQQQIVGNTRGMRQMNSTMMQLSFGVQDFVQVYGQTGLSGALRASVNNFSQVFAIMGGGVGVLGSLGLTLAGIGWAQFMEGAEESAESVDKLADAVDKVNDSIDEMAQKRLEQIRFDRLLATGDVSSFSSQLQDRLDELRKAQSEMRNIREKGMRQARFQARQRIREQFAETRTELGFRELVQSGLTAEDRARFQEVDVAIRTEAVGDQQRAGESDEQTRNRLLEERVALIEKAKRRLADIKSREIFGQDFQQNLADSAKRANELREQASELNLELNRAMRAELPRRMTQEFGTDLERRLQSIKELRSELISQAVASGAAGRGNIIQEIQAEIDQAREALFAEQMDGLFEKSELERELETLREMRDAALEAVKAAREAGMAPARTEQEVQQEFERRKKELEDAERDRRQDAFLDFTQTSEEKKLAAIEEDRTAALDAVNEQFQAGDIGFDRLMEKEREINERAESRRKDVTLSGVRDIEERNRKRRLKDAGALGDAEEVRKRLEKDEKEIDKRFFEGDINEEQWKQLRGGAFARAESQIADIQESALKNLAQQQKREIGFSGAADLSKQIQSALAPKSPAEKKMEKLQEDQKKELKNTVEELKKMNEKLEEGIVPEARLAK